MLVMTLYVTGQRAGAVFAIELATRQIRSVAVGSEPAGIAVSADGSTVFVACTQDATVVAVDAARLEVIARIAVPAAPWGLAWSPVDDALLVTHLFGAGVTAIDPVIGGAPSVRATWTVPATAPRDDQRLAHGQVRGVYDVARRPGGDELWVAHLLLGTDTAQPALDFQSTVFPAVSILHAGGRYQATLSVDAQDVPAIDGAFGDVVSGPHAIAFTPDGAYALVVDTSSEDHTTLALEIPSTTIGAPFAISIDLGAAPGPGTYTARSLATPWSADGLHEHDGTSCLYHAGAAAVPPGTFTLTLDAIDSAGAHGRLDLVLYVLSRPYTYCGETNIERIVLTF